ncbi:DUF2341 domain-containing protein [bacterium]|nr:DUF2341 domain-containing protein [bacterium]
MKKPVLILLFLIIITNLYADIPGEMNYQGKITDTLGVARNGYFTMTFKIFDVPAGGDSLWTETHDSVLVHKGLFDVVLGSINPIDLNFDDPYWLEIVVEGEVLTPRIKFAAVPYAFSSASTNFADSSGAIDWGNITSMPGGFADGIDDTGVVNWDTLNAFYDTLHLQTAGNSRVHWDNLTDVPAGFADGVDNTGGDDALTISLTAADTIAIGNAVYWGDNNSLPGFNYFTPIYIDNTASSPLYEYQVEVNIGPSATGFWSHVNADGSDIRFLDGDRMTFLHYWVDDWSYPMTATVWVRVPYIPAQKLKVIYLYYGNSTATLLSDGISTFDYFEQFDVLDTVRHWEKHNTVYSSGTWGKEIEAAIGSPAPCFRVWSESSGSHGAVIHWSRVDGLSVSDQYSLHYWVQSENSLAEGSATIRIYDDSKSSSNTAFWRPGTNITEESDYAFTPTTSTIYIYLRFWDSQVGWNMSARWDDLRIRKNISPEPTVIVGMERNATSTGLWRARSGDGDRCIGVATSAGNPGEAVDVCTYGTAAGLSGLVANRLYYITDSPGMMDTTPSAFVAPVGVATSANELRIKR